MESIDLSFKTKQGCFIYRVAAIIIKENKLLLVKHVDFSCYYTVGGKVKYNETSEEAVIREVYEETGIEFQVEKLIYIQERFCDLVDGNHHELIFYYLMKDNNYFFNNGYTDQSKEFLHWIPLNDLDTITIVPDFFKNELYKNIKNIAYIKHIISRENDSCLLLL